LEKQIDVLLLCGGKGERMRPITQTIPKPLVLINNRPILDYIISHVRKFDFKKFIIATGYKSEKIASHFNKEVDSGEVILVDSGEVDIIKRICDARELITGDLVMCYGDTLSDVNLRELIRFHESHPGKVTVTLWPLQSQFGILEIEDDCRISSFREKPVLDKWINIGYFYIENEVLGWLDKFSKFEDFLTSLVSQNELYGFRHRGLHITVNTHQELKEAENNINKIIELY